jgi:hypothetical protein
VIAAKITALALILCANLACGVKGKPRPPDTRAQIQAALQQISSSLPEEQRASCYPHTDLKN